MIDSKFSKSINDFFILQLFFLSFNNMEGTIKNIGLFSLVFTLSVSSLFLLIFLLKNVVITKDKIKLLIVYIIVLAFSFLGTLINPSNRAFIRIIQIILVINFFLFFSKARFNKNTLSYKKLFLCLTFFLIIYYVSLLINRNNINSIYANSNTLGIFSFLFFILSIIMNTFNKKTINNIYSILFIIMVLISDSRSNIIGLFIFMVTILIYKYISKSKLRWNLFIILVISFIVLFTYIYPNLYRYDVFELLSELTYKLTNKNLYSGRNVIWSNCIEFIKQRIWFGYGTGIQVSDLFDVNLSAHNFYIQVTLQSGIVGLSILFVFLVLIWNLLYCKQNDKLIKICSGFYVSVLILNVFEITLFQNNLSAGIIQWFIISIGVSKSYEYRYEAKQN